METTINLHDYVRSAVGEALCPFDGAEIVASKCVNSISDFEHDCSNSVHQYSMVVCRVPYSWKRSEIDRYKLEIQTEDWVNFVQILLGYEVKRYVAVLVPLDGSSSTDSAEYCIKAVASVYRDDSPLDIATLSKDIKRILTCNGIMFDGEIAVDHIHSDRDYDSSTMKLSSAIESDSMTTESESDRRAFFKKLKQKLIMEITGQRPASSFMTNE